MIDFAKELERRRARVVSWYVPVKTPSPLNGSHGHWAVRARMAAEHHEETVTRAPKDITWTFPVVVVLRRYFCGQSRPHDRDNLAASLKYITDGVAEVLGVDDGDEARFRVQYEQERMAKKRDVGVLVTVVQGARVVEHLVFDDGGEAA